jgi:hypothetical protein
MIAQVNQRLFSSSCFHVNQAVKIEMSPPDTVIAVERSRYQQTTHSGPPPKENLHISNNLLQFIAQLRSHFHAWHIDLLSLLVNSRFRDTHILDILSDRIPLPHRPLRTFR